MIVATEVAPAADAWAFGDDVVRLRQWATDRSYALPADRSAAVTIGSSEACALPLIDPSGQMSRRHAELVREAGRWVARDLDSTNGMWLDGVRRAAAALE